MKASSATSVPACQSRVQHTYIITNKTNNDELNEDDEIVLSPCVSIIAI